MSAPQQIASDPNISAKVSANAGTGKTWVLANRVLRLLLAGVHPSKILCLTFTKAAAAEMKGRVVKILKDWVLLSEDKLSHEIYELTGEKPTPEILQRASQLFTHILHSMPPPRIQTIHSFAQEILSKFPLEAGITPHFEVLDEITSNELIGEAKLRLLSVRHLAQDINDAVDFLAANCSEERFNNLLDAIIKNRIKFRLSNLPEINLSATKFDFSDIAFSKIANAMLNSTNENDNERGNNLTRAIQENNFALIEDIFLKKDGDPIILNRVLTQKGLKFLPEGMELLGAIQQKIFEFSSNLRLKAELEFARNAYIAGQGLLKIYDDIKFTLGALDYDDLILYARQLLLDSKSAQWILYKLDSSIEHILVDEAQDTTPQQWEIISAIVEEFFAGEGAAKQNRTVFIVGDEKQSIYSFQGADPASFAKITALIGQKCSYAEKTWREIPLNKSFRSVPKILQFVDKVFAPKNIRAAVTTDNKIIGHAAERKSASGKVEIWPLIEGEGNGESAEWEPPTKIYSHKNEKTLLAENIAGKIGEWVNSGKASPSDIIILLRKRSNFADLLIRKLKGAGVPVSGLDRLKLVDNIGMEDLLSLAQFLLLPEDDLSLAEVLKSPLFSISEDDLFRICYGRKGSLWEALDNPEIKTELENLLAMLDNISIYELFSHVLDINGGRKKFVARLGEAVNDPLDEFLSLTIQFEQNHINSLQEFVHWFVRGGTEIKRDMENKSGEVRIMTIHAAKGLQSKIVILPDTTGLPEKNKKQIYIDEAEIFYAFPSNELHSQLAKSIIQAHAKKDYDEYLRLLYVALTRAEDEIIIAGYQGKNQVNSASWYGLLTDAGGVHISDL